MNHRANERLELSLMAQADAEEIRSFCLATINEAFGYHYRSDWHGDLDELLEPEHAYHPDRHGAFVVARLGGMVVACGGLKGLAATPHLAERFAPRYGDSRAVGSIWRVYVKPEQRSRGLGAQLATNLEHRAHGYGYDRLYLHTSARTPRSVAFWRRQGYHAFCHDSGSDDSTVHMEKPVPVAAGPADQAVDLRLAAQPDWSGLPAPLGRVPSAAGPRPGAQS